jgi:hypothetical protein
MRIYVVATLAISAFVGACVTLDSGNARRLRGMEIERALYGNLLQTLPRANQSARHIVLPPTHEFFCRGGYWELRGGRASVPSRFVIEEDTFCVERAEFGCRHLYVDSSGRYFTRTIAEGEEKPVTITPAQNAETCR